ncbi:DedA family protein [Rhizobium sp. AN80A]|uniref:DedA family protein n=1 Tax=Rhizobium sp. AN80A TaxID=3040673 RepID=UPI0024B3BB81|nr:DedA family protein [Rhizobium sp. AN80A]
MDTLVSIIIDFIKANQSWAPVIMGLIAFAESVFVIGFFVPATPLFIVAGALVASGAIDAIPMVAATILGAVLGDIVSYRIGSTSGRRIIYSPWGKKHRARAAKARAFFRRYGPLSVFMGRFLGPLRCTVPFMAGMMRMDMFRFQVANVVSAVVWVPVMLLPSWLAIKGISLI